MVEGYEVKRNGRSIFAGRDSQRARQSIARSRHEARFVEVNCAETIQEPKNSSFASDIQQSRQSCDRQNSVRKGERTWI